MTAHQLRRVTIPWDNGVASLLETLALQVESLKWQEDSLCREMDPDLFFDDPEAPTSLADARRACGMCPVRADCLEWALSGFNDDEDAHGIFGGVGPGIRRKMRAARRRLGVAA